MQNYRILLKLTLDFRPFANFNNYHAVLLVFINCIGVKEKMAIRWYISEIYFKIFLKMYTLIVAHKIRCIILFHFEFIMTEFMNSNARLHGYLRKLFHPVSLKSENATK